MSWHGRRIENFAFFGNQVFRLEKIFLLLSHFREASGTHRADYSRKKLDEIIVARLTDIFELIETHLKKIGRNGLLPAGIVITGGTSRIATIEDLAKASLNLPSKIASMHFGGNIKDLNDSVWSVAYGLTILGLSEESRPAGAGVVTAIKKARMWMKQFLP